MLVLADVSLDHVSTAMRNTGRRLPTIDCSALPSDPVNFTCRLHGRTDYPSKRRCRKSLLQTLAKPRTSLYSPSMQAFAKVVGEVALRSADAFCNHAFPMLNRGSDV